MAISNWKVGQQINKGVGRISASPRERNDQYNDIMNAKEQRRVEKAQP